MPATITPAAPYRLEWESAERAAESIMAKATIVQDVVYHPRKGVPEALSTMTSARTKALEPPSGWNSLQVPRLSLLRREQLPLFPRVMLRIFGKRARVSAPNLFMTLMRHGRLF